jgi:hypothetical protein
VCTSHAAVGAEGKTVCIEPRVAVGNPCVGSTGPIERSEAAKSGSRPSRSIAFAWLVTLFGVRSAGGVPVDFVREAFSLEWY